MTPVAATLTGGGAILLWATLALFTTWTGGIPPFQLTTMAFLVAFLLALGKWLLRGESIRAHVRQPLGAWLLGAFGLFGYHALYFFALRRAPTVEANLVNYLWPLLIVLFSGLLPGERLRTHHIAGALIGFAGAALLLARGAAFRAEHAAGYLAALGCAVVWAVYSVGARRYARVPTDAVGGFCLGACLLSALAHVVFEETAPIAPAQWPVVLAIGVGPVGAAFFLWDIGVKRGDIHALGAASYATPLLSTLLLLGFGAGALGWRIALAAVLITAGGVLAGRDLFRPPSAGRPARSPASTDAA
jgi:drug/metabolite transporter (DMT)-like permease